MPTDDSPPRPRLRVVIVDDEGRPLRAPALATWLASVAPARARGAVTIAVVSDRRVRALNRKYRGLDRATDVLSFPAAPEPREATPARTRSPLIAPGVSDPPDRLRPGLRRVRRRVAKAEGRLRSSHPIAPARTRSHPAREDRFLGDVVIARGVAARQARTAGHPERTEWRVLALHGLLHLLGYDHECDGGEMRRVERRLRRKGGLGAGLIEREGAR